MHLTPRYPVFLHGGDYNPDQWLDRPDILEKDVELMQKAHVNCVSVGIFSWTRLEPEEGVYDFEWLDQVIDRLWQGGIHVVLATPSGARPAWLAQKYPEVLRVDDCFQRAHFGGRHNHCPSSPVYLEKVRAINTALARRYAAHPAVILWHLSNEYGGDCRCGLCTQRWREWLKNKYGDLESLNRRWWTAFWSHRYTDWSQIEPPSPIGMRHTTSMWVDWRRFSTWQCKQFMIQEREAVKAVNPELPVTANLMARFWEYDYFDLAEEMDVVSWDAYPMWHMADDVQMAADFAMNHEMMRSLKDQPFLMMESTPSKVNWRPINKLKRPGMHLLSSMQALAHGSQSVMYFQWRKGRGGTESFHGAVVDHDGREDHRVFRDVAEVGRALERLQPIYDVPRARAEACVIFDWNNWWAIDYAQNAHNGNMDYFDFVISHYRSLWQQGVSIDFRDMRACTDLSGYKLVVCPMVFMFREGFEQKLRAFVEKGGTLLLTCYSGVVDGDDLAFLGGRPGGLTDVLGLRATEVDAIYPHDEQYLRLRDGRTFRIHDLCELSASEGAEALGEYTHDFYAGMPCLTRHRFGQGEAWYLAAKVEQAGLDAVYAELADRIGLTRALPDPLPAGVVPTERGGCVFLQNYSGRAQTVTLSDTYMDLLTDETVDGIFELPANGLRILKRKIVF